MQQNGFKVQDVKDINIFYFILNLTCTVSKKRKKKKKQYEEPLFCFLFKLYLRRLTQWLEKGQRRHRIISELFIMSANYIPYIRCWGGMLWTVLPIIPLWLPDKHRPLRIDHGFVRFFAVCSPVVHRAWFFIQNELFRRKPDSPAHADCPGITKLTHLKMMAGCWLDECKREGKIVVGNDEGDDKNVGRI